MPEDNDTKKYITLDEAIREAAELIALKEMEYWDAEMEKIEYEPSERLEAMIRHLLESYKQNNI